MQKFLRVNRHKNIFIGNPDPDDKAMLQHLGRSDRKKTEIQHSKRGEYIAKILQRQSSQNIFKRNPDPDTKEISLLHGRSEKEQKLIYIKLLTDTKPENQHPKRGESLVNVLCR